MTYLFSVLMGVLQGIAEFLPISSSGHLALFQHFFGVENYEETQMFSRCFSISARWSLCASITGGMSSI